MHHKMPCADRQDHPLASWVPQAGSLTLSAGCHRPRPSAAPPTPSTGCLADAPGFCRLAANRITPAELDPYVTGDRDRAAEVLAAACTLALD